jgi:ferredoxin
VDTCPVGALRIGASGVELQGGCTGCGRCEARCPTGALAATGFAGALQGVATGKAGEVLLECARFAHHPADARVPCLGGVSAAALLALCARVPERPVVLVDRGACGTCDSGGVDHPAAVVVAQVAGWMRTAGVPQPRLPRIAPLQCGGGGRAAPGEDPLQARGRARRGFLGALTRPAGAPTVHRDSSPPRGAILSVLSGLAAQYGGAVAPELFHHLEVAADCRGLRVCAATCPTGALVRYRDEATGHNGIAFDTHDCIGCNHCAAVCPNQAIRLLPGPGAGAGQRPLTQFARRDCGTCGAPFTLAAGEQHTHCDRCRKKVQLASAAFKTLFSANTRLQGME